MVKAREQESYYIAAYNQGKQDGIEQEAQRQESLKPNNNRIYPRN